MAHDQERDKPDQPEAGAADLGGFPWSDSPGGEQAARSWEEAAPGGGQSPAVGGEAAPVSATGQPAGNGLAIGGFVVSIVALILSFVSVLDLVFIVPAIVFSAVGLRRANSQGRPHRRLAIAGLTISLVALILMIVLTVLYVGLANRFEEGADSGARGGSPVASQLAADS